MRFDSLTFIIACVLLKGYDLKLFNYLTILYLTSVLKSVLYNIRDCIKTFALNFQHYILCTVQLTHETIYSELLAYIKVELIILQKENTKVLKFKYLGVDNENWWRVQAKLEPCLIIDKDSNNISIDLELYKNHNFDKYDMESVLQKYFK